jgi:hypothetical protein
MEINSMSMPEAYLAKQVGSFPINSLVVTRVVTISIKPLHQNSCPARHGIFSTMMGLVQVEKYMQILL